MALLVPRDNVAHEREQIRETLKQAPESAVAKEVEAEAFYRSWSERAKAPGVKKLFSELAVWEQEQPRSCPGSLPIEVDPV